MKRGNSIVAGRCPRMPHLLSRPILSLFMHPRILRKNLFFNGQRGG